MTYLTNKYINQFNTYFKIAYVIWHPTYKTNAKSQLQGHLLSLTTHFSKIFYFPMAQVSGCMPCLYQTMKHGASSVKQATQACSEPKFNRSTILEKAFYEQYLEANWHCWIYFRFYQSVEIWQVTSYHQQDPYGHPACHLGLYQTGCKVTLLGSYQGPLQRLRKEEK